MRILVFLSVLLALACAELSLSGGFTWGRQVQSLSGADTARSAVDIPLRLAVFLEADSLAHPLFLPNDQVVYGLGFLPEVHYKDLLIDADHQLSIPLYVTYYLRYGTQAVGFGLNLNLLQLRRRNDVKMQGQQLGKHLFWRINGNDSYVELGLMQLCAQGYYAAEDVLSFYDTLNFIWKYGFYLGGKNKMD